MGCVIYNSIFTQIPKSSRLYSRACYIRENTVLIDGNIIPQVSTTKFLGIYIDQYLNWSEHIKIISMKIAKNAGILNRLASYVPKQVLLNLYYSLIYPYLAYGNIVWASNYMHRLHKI